jgi:CheY-like chemotaxis protein/HPt (histidine-containing phosphotransfer) domain-containing protein
MDLKTKLAFALVSASLLSMAVLGYFTYLWAEDLFLEDSQHQLDAVAESKKDAINGVFARWKEEVYALVARAQSAQLARSHPSPPDATSMERIARVLRDAQASSHSLRRVMLFDVQGNPLSGAGAESKAIAGVPDDDVAFFGIRVEANHSISAIFHAWLTLDGHRVGLVEAVLDAQPLERFVGHTAEIGETGETSLIVPTRTAPSSPRSADDGYFVVSSSRHSVEVDRERRALSEAPATASAALRGQEQVFAKVTDHRGHEVMAVTRFLPEPGWGLVVQVDRVEARQRADQLLANMRDLGVSLAAFAILGGTLFGLYLGRPIHKLVQEVDRIRHGELGLRLDAGGEDEVAFLAQSLNEFMDQLDRSSDLFQLGEMSVLVVDSDAKNRQLLQDLLQNWKMRPTPAESGAAALSAFEQARRAGQPLQLVLLDESLPDMDSTRLAARLRSSNSGPFPIILLSSQVDLLDADRLKEAGIGRILPRPVVASHLMEAILDEMGVSAEGLASTTDAYLKKTTPRKILLVEDNALIQRVMIGFLENWGHEVRLAENGRIALESIQREHFDLILMDVEMPEMNGLDATAAIRAHEHKDTGRTPIIALTAEAMTGDRERCLAGGMDDYISKPVDPKALYALIQRYPAQMLASRPPDDEQRTSQAAAIPVPEVDEGVVDWDLARSLTGGDEALLDDLIEVFPEESSRQLEAMRRGIENRDAQLLTRSAHSLKSAALVFGASRLAEAALSMETLGRRAELKDAGPLLQTLEIETSRLNATLASQRGRGVTHG